MKDFEYREIKQKGEAEFKKINHNLILNGMLKNDLKDIIEFPKKDYYEIQKYQLEKLSKIVDYAYLNIPLYKKKYESVGYTPGSIKTFQDFEKLPILYKEELINGFSKDIVKSIDDFKYSTRSSGSSGKFVTLAVDLNAIYTDTLQGIRQFYWQTNFNYKDSDKVLFIYTCPWWITDINGKYQLDFLPTTARPSEVLEFIKKTHPFIISTYPTYLQKMCELNVKLSDYEVRYAIVHSEHSTKKARDDMSKSLGIVVVDEYSSEELTRIALECPSGNYHIEEDACYIEVLDMQTKKKIESGTGLVVGTNLLNLATPIIRYHQGDIVKIETNKKCNCGHNGRIISQINGREMDCILSKGEKIPASAFMDLAYNWFLTNKVPVHGIKYQIVQKSEKEICILLMKGLYELDNIDLKIIKESIYSLVNKDINVEVQFTDKFIYTSNKFKPVINLIGVK